MKYPDYTGIDPEKLNRDVIGKVSGKDFETLKKCHLADYKSLYDRVTFSVEGDGEAEKFPTNERFIKLRKGNSDPAIRHLLLILADT